MGVTVLYFAAARDAAGTPSETLEPTPADVAALRARVASLHPALARILARCRIALDQEFVGDDAPIRDGVELAVIPPVSGGAGRCRVVERPLLLSEAVDAVQGADRGGVVTFTGIVRGVTDDRRVLRLEYEAYAAMAERKLEEIAAAVERETGATVAVVHRIGTLVPGDAAVVIACAAPHRAPAFRACEAVIERLKHEVPVWKREVFEDGSVWVGTGP